MHFNKVQLSAVALTILSALNSPVLIAGAMGTPATDTKPGHFIAQLGGYAAVQGTPQTIHFRQNSNIDRYTVDSSNQGSGLVGLGYFLNGPLIYNRVLFTYGVNAFFLGQTSVNGRIIENNVTNRAYSYNIQHIPLYFSGKTIINTNSDKFKVALDAGIGPNFMSVSNYREISLANSTVPARTFADRNPAAFAATAGASVLFTSNPDQLPIECGYRFFYLGQGQFDIRNVQAANAIKTGYNYANAVVCGITI